MSNQNPEVKTNQAKAWMPFWIGDYLADTMHLSTLQHGAYLLMILHYWRKGPIPNNRKMLRNITGMNDYEIKTSLPEVLNFFERVGGDDNDKFLAHKRIDSELIKAQEIRANLSERGKKAINARWDKVRNTQSKIDTWGNTQVILADTPSPSPSNNKNKSTPLPPKKKKPSSLLALLPDEFNSLDIQTSFLEFIEYRKQLKKPLTELSIKKLIQEYSSLPSRTFIEAVNFTISKGWQGLRSPDQNNSMAGQNGYDKRTSYERQMDFLKTEFNKEDSK